jgi:hypothetical protein
MRLEHMDGRSSGKRQSTLRSSSTQAPSPSTHHCHLSPKHPPRLSSRNQRLHSAPPANRNPRSNAPARIAFAAVYTTLVLLTALEVALYHASRLDNDGYLASAVAKTALSSAVWLACVVGPTAAALFDGPSMYLPPPAFLLAAALVACVIAQ